MEIEFSTKKEADKSAHHKTLAMSVKQLQFVKSDIFLWFAEFVDYQRFSTRQWRRLVRVYISDDLTNEISLYWPKICILKLDY